MQVAARGYRLVSAAFDGAEVGQFLRQRFGQIKAQPGLVADAHHAARRLIRKAVLRRIVEVLHEAAQVFETLAQRVFVLFFTEVPHHENGVFVRAVQHLL